MRSYPLRPLRRLRLLRLAFYHNRSGGEMGLELAGQVSVVVGAASGIGRAIAAAFAAEGAAVALLDRAENVYNAAREIAAATDARTLGITADVTDYGALQQAAQRIDAELGAVDHLAYAAGMGSGKGGFPFWNLEPSDWPRVVEVNLLGAVNTAHAFVPGFVSRRHGTLLFISSVAGQIGSQTDPPYSAAKAALINFSQCAAKDLAHYNVRVNTICPGMVKTPLNRGVWEGQMKNLPPEQRVDYDTWADDKIGRLVPLRRWQSPEDIAQMAVFLASPRAGNVTGQTINVDGGYVMHW
jgi:NAD(P)-dependent dehydrogenase (short-subunit alcohol dehydrogenase family)